MLESPQIWHINRSWKRQPGSFEFPDPVQGITCMLFDTFGPWTHGILISTARIEYGESSKHNLNSDWWKQINSPGWAPTSYEVIPPISRVVTPVIYSVVRPFIVVITPFITRGPPCSGLQKNTKNKYMWISKHWFLVFPNTFWHSV